MSNSNKSDFDIFPKVENENFIDVDVKIESSVDDGSGDGLGTKVILFNDNYHTFKQVINQIMIAIKCSEQTAYYHAYTVHTKGKSTVFKGDIQDCLRVSSILQEINLKTQIVG